MSIHYERRPNEVHPLSPFFDIGDWVVQCDVCHEPIEGEGNVKVTPDGTQFWTVHKINADGQHCGYSLVSHLREQGVFTAWQDIDGMLRALASRYCASCYERKPSAIDQALADAQ